MLVALRIRANFDCVRWLIRRPPAIHLAIQFSRGHRISTYHIVCDVTQNSLFSIHLLCHAMAVWSFSGLARLLLSRLFRMGRTTHSIVCKLCVCVCIICIIHITNLISLLALWALYIFQCFVDNDVVVVLLVVLLCVGNQPTFNGLNVNCSILRMITSFEPPRQRFVSIFSIERTTSCGDNKIHELFGDGSHFNLHTTILRKINAGEN